MIKNADDVIRLRREELERKKQLEYERCEAKRQKEQLVRDKANQNFWSMANMATQVLQKLYQESAEFKLYIDLAFDHRYENFAFEIFKEQHGTYEDYASAMVSGLTGGSGNGRICPRYYVLRMNKNFEFDIENDFASNLPSCCLKKMTKIFGSLSDPMRAVELIIRTLGDAFLS